jgi:hypothetical protein
LLALNYTIDFHEIKEQKEDQPQRKQWQKYQVGEGLTAPKIFT